MAAQTPTSRRTPWQIARSFAIVMLGFGGAKAISLVQTFIIADVFGAGRAWDAYVSASRIPDLIFTLIAGGAMSFAFIPVFSGLLARGDTEQAWRTASHVINSIFCTTLIISIIAFLAAPWIISNLVASGFDPEQQAQTVGLMRILLIGTLIFSISGIVMGILYSHNHYLLPALAPIMLDVGILFGVVFLIRPFGVAGIAYGAVIGSALHLLIQVPGLIRYRARWFPELGLRDPHFWNVVRLMIPRIGGLGVFSFNFIVMTNIASRLGTGSVAALDWGWKLMQIPETMIGTAMGTVIFPTLAALSELKDEVGKRTAMVGALRFILIATIPSAIGLILVGRPLISLLERGEFTAATGDLVYGTLQAFTLGLVVHSLLEVIARSFYADKDTMTPFWAALGGAIINFGLAYALSGVNTIQLRLVPIFTSPDLGMPELFPYIYADQGSVAGLALANSLGVSFEVIALLVILRRRWHGLQETALSRTLAKTLVASLVMGLAVIAVSTVWTAVGLSGRGVALTVVQLIVEVGVGGVAFIAAAALLKMEELSTLIGIILRRNRLAEAPAT
jgi:putative peptidoglycan lipid II flippase